MQRSLVPLTQHVLPKITAVTETVRVIEPTAGGDTQIVKKAPLPQRYIDDQCGRIGELLISGAQVLRHIREDVFVDPAATCHDDTARFGLEQRATLFVRHFDAAVTLARMLVLDS